MEEQMITEKWLTHLNRMDSDTHLNIAHRYKQDTKAMYDRQ
jgi:hypothetical protein